MTKGEPHIDYSKFDTIKIGNEIAERIKANGPRPNYNATLRHVLAKQGAWEAEDLAMTLLGLNQFDAIKHITKLSASKPDDIISPHYEE